MPYAIRLPDGTLVENIPDDLDPKEAKRRLVTAGLVKGPETTTAGQVKEFAKGIPAGAIGLLETAAVGASNILPQAEEDSAKKAIREFASAVKQPFAAAEGYEDTVGRKFGEGFGSTGPFFALGPLGMAGRVAAAALAAGAGAGEASTRAEAKGATQDQQTLATIGGTAVGLTEMLPVFHFLEKLGGPVKDGIIAYVRRAAATGGAEGAQEAAAQMAQNLIAQKVYDPSQALVEGSGEAGAYGFGVGALIQGITDMALGRKGGSGVSGGTTPIEEVRAAARAKAEAAKTKEQTPPLQLGYDQNPQLPPMIAFPDGTVATREEAEQYIASLPEEEQVAARAKLYGLGAQDAGRSVEKKGFDYAGDTTTGELFTDVEQPAGTDYDARAFETGSILDEAPEGEARAEQVTEATLERLGLAVRTGKEGNPYSVKSTLGKRILGKRLDRTSELKYVRDEVEKYLEKGYGKPEQREALDGFLRNIDAFTAPTKEMNFAPPRVRKKGQRDNVLRPVEPAGTEGTVGETDTTPSQPSVGVASEPVAEFTAPETVTSPVGVSEPATTAGNGESTGQQPALTGTDMRVRTVEADAINQQRETGPEVQQRLDAIDREKTTRNELLRERKRVLDDLKALHDESGNPLPDTEQARFEATRAYEDIQQRIKNQDDTLRVLKAEITKAEALESEKTGREYYEAIGIPEDRETWAEVSQRIDQAVGAYNREPTEAIEKAKTRAEQDALRRANETRRKLAVDYIVDTLGYYSKKVRVPATNSDGSPVLNAKGKQVYDSVPDYSPPTGDSESAKSDRKRYTYALNALAYGVDIKSLSPKQRAALLKALNIDRLKFEAQSAPQQRRAIEEAADKLLAGPAQSWGDQLFQRGKATNSREEQLDINLELRGKKNPIDVADWVARTAPSSAYKSIASAVASRLRKMQEQGTTFTFGITNDLPGARGMVRNSVSDKGQVTTSVLIRGLGSEQNGLSYETILHELLHAATSAAVHSPKNLPIKRQLEKLLEQVRGATQGQYNQLDNVEEMLAWGMTNPGFQQTLENIPATKGSLWDRFVEIIREFLGRPAKMDSALSELIKLGSDLLSADVANDIKIESVDRQIATPETEAVANYDIIGTKDRPGFTDRASAELGPNKVRGLRTKLTDKLAAVDDIFTRAWNGRVRDSEGVLNPIVLISRALDSLRVSKAVQETGGLSKVDDLYVASELTIPEDSTEFPLIAGQSVSYQKVLQRIAAAAKQDGRTYEAEQRIIDSVLYGRREYELRQAEANGQGPFEYLLTAEQAAQANQAFENNADIQEISQMLDAIRYNLIDSMVDSGRISSDQADAWKAATGYIPFKRLSEDDVVGALSNARGVNQGIAALRNIKRFKGSEDRKSTSVIENFSGLVDYMTTETMRNDAGLQALETLELLNYARRIPTPDVIDNDRKAGIARVFKDGKAQFYFMEDPALAVVFSQQPAQVSNVLRGLQKASQVLRAGVTAAPPFAIKQIFDDIIRAYTYAGVQRPGPMMVRILSSFPKNWYNEALGKKSTAVKELERLGIIGTFDFTESSNLQNVMEEAGAKQRGIGATILRVMEAGAKASDISVREAVYKQVLKETGDVAAAESRAREIINFSRRGSAKAMDYMVRIVPFFNAYARGMDKLLVAAAGNSVGMSTGQARSKFLQRMTTLTTMGFLYAILMQDDEDYNALPDHVRDQNWILPYGKELGFTPAIPLPAELAFLFKAIPERIIQYYKLSGTDEERTALQYIKELTLRGFDIYTSPNVTPQLIKPLMENIANYSFFLGRPLESQSQVANLRPFQRYGTGTSEVAKALGVGLENVSNATGVDVGVSPIKIENLIRGLLGTTAGTVLAFSDILINPSRADRPLHRNEFAQATGASALMKDKLGTRYLDELYNLEKETNQIHGTFNKLKASDPERAVEFLEQNYGLYSIRNTVQNYMQRIRELNAMAMKVDKSDDFTPQEKREFIDEMKEYQLQLARDVFALRKLARDAQSSM